MRLGVGQASAGTPRQQDSRRKTGWWLLDASAQALVWRSYEEAEAPGLTEIQLSATASQAVLRLSPVNQMDVGHAAS